MNSKELEEAMLKDKYIRKIFLGVFPLDKIPKEIPSPSIFIVNQDPSNKKGSHWIVLHFINEKTVEHFDSLGKKPLSSINNLLLQKNMTYKYNNRRLQNFKSNTCGLYCLFYSYYSCRGFSFSSILAAFGKDLDKNDKNVTRFYLETFVV